MNPPTIHSILLQYWGYSQFRPLQEDIIQSTILGKDCLALLPTGGGKSLCFQVPGLYLGGLTLVISPLIALMKDQVERLEKLGISAAYLHGGLPQRTIDLRLQAAMDGKYQFLYVAPERVRSEIFMSRLAKMPVKLLAIDEAHCISQWGYDFRPAYLDIPLIRKVHPKIPIIALTASATPVVKKDILEKLELKNPEIFSKSFRRDNLRYFVLPEENVVGRIIEIAQRTVGTGIVYARTRNHTERIAETLRQQGISAAAYHGGLTHLQREKSQQQWINNEFRIMVATNAFGMGIDKPDVRFVLHLHLPADLESYYQEAGRGGRDEQTALAIAFLNAGDISELKQWVANKYPSWEDLTEVWTLLCNYFQVPIEFEVSPLYDFDLSTLVKHWNKPIRTVHNVLSILANENFIYWSEDKDEYSYLQVIASPQDLLAFKQRHPKLSELPDMILRTMGGVVYSREVPFLLRAWALMMNWKEEELDKQLQYLAQVKLISYQASTLQPTIRFLKGRNALTKLNINWEKYTFLRRQAAWRLDEMLKYIESKDFCRSLLIQHYFGEVDTQPCGKCDVCVHKRKNALEPRELITQKFTELLSERSISYREILQIAQAGTPELREETLRYLIDKGVILTDKFGKLRLNQA